MQQPTLESVRIRSTRDALQVFYGVATNKIPLITRRLDAEERRAIVAGNVYVWEERGANTEPIGIGMERWTDGMGWGPSRVRDDFLFYHQKESDIEDDSLSPITPWAQLLRLSTSPNMGHIESERLVKQTYSVHVSLPADRTRGIVRKWHLTAYFSLEKLSQLRTIDSVRGIGNVSVPDGLFRSARANKARRDAGVEVSLPSTSLITETAIPSVTLPSSPQGHPGAITHSSYSRSSIKTTMTPSTSSSSSSSNSSPVFIHTPTTTPPKQLVPLLYLQNNTSPRRDPADEQLLRRFNTLSSRGSHRK
ncbi:Gti1/Pac2 family-domain-containing protein [Lentinula lateritia]|uniref:Gti1/Pac2 family-domain-containing protein n=1 Tax=Lentinula aff. lateritia TaxID=2804960 RepID=A0ACC1U7L8_9AGAR|nr:Gti1/Pac2 family-domain-containing protein [Lentinula aff. lateritia]KAJ3848910.1 Gti1/Pac2 family-domain-containing protein [Lentinula lateritia]